MEVSVAVFVSVLIVPIIFFGELWIKNRVEKYIPVRNGSKEKKLFGGRILLRRYHNRGAVLGVGEKKRRIVAALSLTLTALMIPVFLFSLGRRGNNPLRVGLALLLGGAFSNTYDRLKRKYVVDYLSFGVKWEKLRGIVFNLSDFCIMIGALLAALAVPE